MLPPRGLASLLVSESERYYAQRENRDAAKTPRSGEDCPPIRRLDLQGEPEPGE